MTPATKLRHQYRSGRSALITMTALTAGNLVLLLVNANISFLFSAALPQLAGLTASTLTGIARVLVLLIGAVIPLGLWTLFYIKSKEKSGYLTAALVLFILDALALALFVYVAKISDSFDYGLVLMVLFEIYILFLLFRGVIAAKKLRAMPDEELVAPPPAPPAIPAADPAAQEDSEQGESAFAPSQSDTQPLRADDGRGQVWIHTTYQGMDVTVRNAITRTTVAVNGMIYAEKRALVAVPFTIGATVGGVTFALTCALKGISVALTLYADGTLIGEQTRAV